MADENRNEMKPFNWEFIQRRAFLLLRSYHMSTLSLLREWIRAMDREIEKSSKDEFDSRSLEQFQTSNQVQATATDSLAG